MAEHTPGPWEAKLQDFGEELWFDDGFWEVGPAIVGASSETAAADARLISAVPELLAALEDCVKKMESEHSCDPPTYQDALAAIAKAKGE